MAALIGSETGLEGGRGEFTVWVGEQTVAAKDRNGFPTDEEALAAVRKAVVTAGEVADRTRSV